VIAVDRMSSMQKVKACGVLVFRREPEPSFLVMKHARRFDLPKGHLESGETDEQCALREMTEETGIPPASVRLEPGFRYQEVYYPYEARFGPGRVEKTLVIFLGWLLNDHPIQPTEHRGYAWLKWNPPHKLQKYTLDPLLQSLSEYFQQRGLP
jgi:8-oxo-dGTP pyrophosphatase MutT (NUDIX family)